MKPDALGWVGKRISEGRYRITSKLGEGGMGYVYRAHDRNLDTDVVIKVPRRALMEDADTVERFIRENRSLVQLAHPHVVRIIDVGQHEGLPFAVMQFLSGGSLEDRRVPGDDGRPLPMAPESIRGWLVDVAKALDFVHSQGFVHRDVKPANILFDQHDYVYLSDFGVIKALSAERRDEAKSLTGTGFVLGTPDYMAPEVILGQDYDGRADQYALAVMVFDLLAGRPPFQSPSPSAVLVQHSTCPPPPLETFVPTIPPSLGLVVMRGMAKSPQQRYATCAEFAEAVLGAVSDATAAADGLSAPMSRPWARPQSSGAGSALWSRVRGALGAGDTKSTTAASPALPGSAPGSVPGTHPYSAIPTAMGAPAPAQGGVAQQRPVRLTWTRSFRALAALAVLAVVAFGVILWRQQRNGATLRPASQPVSVTAIRSELEDWKKRAESVDLQPRVNEILGPMKYGSAAELQKMLDTEEGLRKASLAALLKALKGDLERIQRQITLAQSPGASLEELGGLGGFLSSRKAELQETLRQCRTECGQQLEPQLALLTQKITSFSYRTRDAEKALSELLDLEGVADDQERKEVGPETVRAALRLFDSSSAALRQLSLSALVLAGNEKGIGAAVESLRQAGGDTKRRATLCLFLVRSGRQEAVGAGIQTFRSQPALLKAIDKDVLSEARKASPDTWKPLADLLVDRASNSSDQLETFRLGCQGRNPEILKQMEKAATGAMKDEALDIIKVLLASKWPQACQTGARLIVPTAEVDWGQFPVPLLDECLATDPPSAAAFARRLVKEGSDEQFRWAMSLYCNQPESVFTKDELAQELRSAKSERLMVAVNELLKADSKKSLFPIYMILPQPPSEFRAEKIQIENIGAFARETPGISRVLRDVLIAGGARETAWALAEEFGPEFQKALAAVIEGRRRDREIIEIAGAWFSRGRSLPTGELRFEITREHVARLETLLTPDYQAWQEYREKVDQDLGKLKEILGAKKDVSPAFSPIVGDLNSFVSLFAQETESCQIMMKICDDCVIRQVKKKGKQAGQIIDVRRSNVELFKQTEPKLLDVAKKLEELEQRRRFLSGGQSDDSSTRRKRYK